MVYYNMLRYIKIDYGILWNIMVCLFYEEVVYSLTLVGSNEDAEEYDNKTGHLSLASHVRAS